MKLRSIQGKVAVITGASSGIGEACAKQLVEEGMQVVLAARSTEKIEKLARDLGPAALAVPTDVGNEQAVTELFDLVQKRWGGLDLLVNNAGVGYHGTVESGPTEEWRATIDANLYGVLFCTRAAIPLLKGRDGAMVSTISSVGGRYGIEGWAVYCATKHAVVGFHDALRKELGPQGIRVSLIEPGAVYTAWGYNVPADKMKARRDQLQALKSEDIANALIYGFCQPGNVNPQELLILPTRQTAP